AILSAQFARMYALLALLSVISSWLYQRLSNHPQATRVTFLLYVIVNVLGTFTHVGFFFVLMGQAIFQFIIKRWEGLQLFLVALCLSVLPYAVLWAAIVKQ